MTTTIDVKNKCEEYYKNKIYNINTPLCTIMKNYGSDKGLSSHNYTTFYNYLFSDIKDDQLNIFELGIGSNHLDVPSNMGINGKPGASLYGWSSYFPNSNIYGGDIDKRILFDTEKIKTFYCDQTNPDIIKNMWEKINTRFDIIIEDGLHKSNANITFFENSINHLKDRRRYSYRK